MNEALEYNHVLIPLDKKRAEKRIPELVEDWIDEKITDDQFFGALIIIQEIMNG